MGKVELNTIANLEGICNWSTNMGYTKLKDITTWESDGSWKDWKLDRLPLEILPEFDILKNQLASCAPIHQNLKDKQGWGNKGKYSTRLGYRRLQKDQDPVRSKALWKFVWDNLGLPKVNFFTWPLAHRKILTGENLIKRGIVGPHRCPLCCQAEETIYHLFIECNFAKHTWSLMLATLEVPPPHLQKIPQVFTSWKRRYPSSLNGKQGRKKIWLALPKFTCWKIWIARNQCIFQDVRPTPIQTTGKAKGLLMEAISASRLQWDQGLNDQETIWMNISQKPTGHPIARKPTNKERWKLRINIQEFKDWTKKENNMGLFFDGASKGNPGAAGAGGVLISPGGKVELRYSWGLGVKSNNEVETLALLKGSQLVAERGMLNL